MKMTFNFFSLHCCSISFFNCPSPTTRKSTSFCLFISEKISGNLSALFTGKRFPTKPTT